jgi:PAS domain S-box-containing protein
MSTQPTDEELEQRVKELEKRLSEQSSVSEDPSKSAFIQDITERKMTEKKLRESQERFKVLTENTSDWIWEVDKDGVYTYTSPVVKDLLGYETDEVVGKTPFDFMAMDESNRVRQIFKDIVESKEPFKDLENINIHKDGRMMVLETNGVPVFDTKGNLLGYRGIDRDVTERKSAEKAIRLSESRLNAAQQIAHVGSWDRNLETGEEYWSEEEFRIYGYEPGEVQPSFELVRSRVHPDDIEEFDKVREADFYGHDAFSQEFRIIRKDGAVRTVNSIITVKRDREGRGKRYFGIIQDVTKQKQMEQALKDSGREYRSTLDAMGDAIHVIDETMCLILENEVFKRWRNALGLSSEVIGSNIFEAYPFLDDKVRQEYQQVFKTGKPMITEEEHVVKNRRIVTETRKFPIHIHETNKKIVTVVHDITRRKHMEAALQKSHDELEIRVKARTKDLEIKTINLEEVNTALGVLIKKRDEDKAEVEERIRANSKELVLPYIEKLENTPLDDRQKAYLSILVSNLNDIISPFSSSLINGYRKLSSAEIQVSDLIKHGKRTKEIAELLSLSARTVESHRKNIRRKLGLRNKRANLRSHLMSMQ